MNNIAFYISDHGFGHASRSIAIIRELIKKDNLKIHIKTSNPLEFIKNSLKDKDNIYFDYLETDIGLILKKNSFELDKDLLVDKLKDWFKEWEILINKEYDFLINKDIDLVISDITPWIFNSANKANIKSVAISNFTWYSQYKEILADKNINLTKIKEAYNKADLFIKYPFGLKVNNKNVINTGLISRKFNQNKIKNKKNKIGNDKKLIYMGIGKSVDYDVLNNIDFNKLDQYNWLFSSGVEVEGDNIYKIPQNESETQNYIAACDYAVTKAGWSTISEAVLSKTPMLLIGREEIPEDRKIINKLVKEGLGIKIDKKKIYQNDNLIKGLKKLKKIDIDNFDYQNKVKETANIIFNHLKERSG